MNEEQKQEYIKKLKTIYADNNEFEKNGKKYHRFVLQKLDLPKEVGKPYINIMYENDDAYVVLNVLEGMTKEEKEKRRKEVESRRKERREAKSELMDKIKAVKTEIRSNIKLSNFAVCEELNVKLDSLLEEYSEKFARKKKV